MDGVRVHVHKGKLNAGRRNMSGDGKDGGHRVERRQGHWAEGRQGHVDLPERSVLFIMVLGFFVFMWFLENQAEHFCCKPLTMKILRMYGMRRKQLVLRNIG